MQYTMLVCDSPKNTTGAEHVCNVYIIILMFWNVRIVDISRLPKTREIYLVSADILPVSHSYGASTKN